MKHRPYNNLLESNRRPASPLGSRQQFGRAVYAQVFIFGGGHSAKRSAEAYVPNLS
jgi:hypothetical protein